jgi:hypothetical protein
MQITRQQGLFDCTKPYHSAWSLCKINQCLLDLSPRPGGDVKTTADKLTTALSGHSPGTQVKPETPWFIYSIASSQKSHSQRGRLLSVTLSFPTFVFVFILPFSFFSLSFALICFVFLFPQPFLSLETNSLQKKIFTPITWGDLGSDPDDFR